MVTQPRKESKISLEKFLEVNSVLVITCFKVARDDMVDSKGCIAQ